MGPIIWDTLYHNVIILILTFLTTTTSSCSVLRPGARCRQQEQGGGQRGSGDVHTGGEIYFRIEYKSFK